jgi:Flp pilus assembly protein TadG
MAATLARAIPGSSPLPEFLQSVLRAFHTSRLRHGPKKNRKSVSQGQAAMFATALFERIRRLVRDLRTANGANVTITFALATVPIVGFVGAAVDYSHANSVKTALQAATDATALMLSKSAAKMSDAELQSQAFKYLAALFTRPEATDLKVQATYSNSNGAQVAVVSSANVKSNFMTMMGVSQMQVVADSKVKWGNVRMRVALVLDTTGSMSSAGKMDALKTATKGLLDQLKAAAVENDDVYVSIIPFSKDVNVGASNSNQDWVDWSEWDDQNGDCDNSGKHFGWGLFRHNNNSGHSDCDNNKGKDKWKSAQHADWNGCVSDRGNSNGPANENYDTNVIPPDNKKKESQFTAEQYDQCSPEIMPLSYDWTAMKNLIDSFYPAGNTNQGIGLAHGWMSLVGGGPYPAPPAMDANHKYMQVIILMTDGLNTENRWYGSQDDIDGRQKMTCDNIHAAGITLYAIQVNTDGDPTSSLLKNCAGSPGKYPDSDKFFLLSSANQMVETFTEIGTKLSNLRIAQ